MYLPSIFSSVCFSFYLIEAVIMVLVQCDWVQFLLLLAPVIYVCLLLFSFDWEIA